MGWRKIQREEPILTWLCVAMWGKVREEPSVGVDGSVVYWFGHRSGAGLRKEMMSSTLDMLGTGHNPCF